VQNRVDRLADHLDLGQELEPRRDVAERADRRRAADRDHERAPAAGAQLTRDPLELGRKVGGALDDVQPGAGQPVEQHIAAALLVRVVPGHPALQHERAV
jgi:hypothetical protein